MPNEELEKLRAEQAGHSGSSDDVNSIKTANPEDLSTTEDDQPVYLPTPPMQSPLSHVIPNPYAFDVTDMYPMPSSDELALDQGYGASYSEQIPDRRFSFSDDDTFHDFTLYPTSQTWSDVSSLQTPESLWPNLTPESSRDQPFSQQQSPSTDEWTSTGFGYSSDTIAEPAGDYLMANQQAPIDDIDYSSMLHVEDQKGPIQQQLIQHQAQEYWPSGLDQDPHISQPGIGQAASRPSPQSSPLLSSESTAESWYWSRRSSRGGTCSSWITSVGDENLQRSAIPDCVGQEQIALTARDSDLVQSATYHQGTLLQQLPANHTDISVDQPQTTAGGFNHLLGLEDTDRSRAKPMTCHRAPDVCIAFMGCTGVGKSTFISHLIRSAIEQHEASPNAMSAQSFGCAGSTSHLLDTPGIDNTTRMDADVPQEISTWLERCHENNTPLSGIDYLHQTENLRIQGSAIQNLSVLKRLCARYADKNLVLNTIVLHTAQPDLSQYLSAEAQVTIHLVDSWYENADDSVRLKTWEVARCTSAEPAFFREAFANSQVFTDGAMMHNNPAREPWNGLGTQRIQELERKSQPHVELTQKYHVYHTAAHLARCSTLRQGHHDAPVDGADLWHGDNGLSCDDFRRSINTSNVSPQAGNGILAEHVARRYPEAKWSRAWLLPVDAGQALRKSLTNVACEGTAKKSSTSISDGFSECLSHGQGLLWVSGTPGSGKLALMRCLANSKIVMEQEILTPLFYTTSPPGLGFPTLHTSMRQDWRALPDGTSLYYSVASQAVLGPEAALTNATCEAMAGTAWTLHCHPATWARLTTWKSPSLQLIGIVSHLAGAQLQLAYQSVVKRACGWWQHLDGLLLFALLAFALRCFSQFLGVSDLCWKGYRDVVIGMSTSY